MASIIKRGTSYQIRVSNGRDADYRQIIEVKTFMPDPSWSPARCEKEVQKAAFAFEQQVKQGKLFKGEKLFFAEFSEKWYQEYVLPNLSPNTHAKYRSSLDTHLLPALGRKRMSELTSYHLQSYLNACVEKGTGAATMNKLLTILRSIFKKAFQWGVIQENTMQRVYLPTCSQPKPTLKFFTADQARIFLSLLDDQVSFQLKVFFYLLLYGGFRRGEALALTWDDIDLSTGEISITKAAYHADGGMKTKEPKTRGSVRSVTMPPSVVALLRQHKDAQAKEAERLRGYWHEGLNWVFTQDNGKLMYDSTPYQAFEKVLRRYNESQPDPERHLPDIPLHGLRHTAATLMIANHIDPVTVAARLGHSQTSTTLNTYAHAMKTGDQKVAQLMEETLQG